MADEFAITEVAIAGDRYVVAVRGTVNLFTSAQLLGTLLAAIDAGHSRLVVDLCDTTFMDSSGMSALLTARKRMARHPDGLIVVACVNEDMTRASRSPSFTSFCASSPRARRRSTHSSSRPHDRLSEQAGVVQVERSSSATTGRTPTTRKARPATAAPAVQDLRRTVACSFTRVSATLYAVYTSHPAHAARLMLEYKGIEHKVINLVLGTHAVALRPLGFRGGTVPALKLDGRRVQGTCAIARALDEAQPEPPLFPADPDERIRVEEAERWGDEILQPVPRRLGNWVLSHRLRMRVRLAREAGLPAPGLLGAAGWPMTWYFARKHGANDTERVRRTMATLPALLDHVDELLAEGTVGGEQRNAADFQIGTSVRLLMTFADLAPALEDRPAARFATELMPDYPTGMPSGLVPQDWLEPLR